MEVTFDYIYFFKCLKKMVCINKLRKSNDIVPTRIDKPIRHSNGITTHKSNGRLSPSQDWIK